MTSTAIEGGLDAGRWPDVARVPRRPVGRIQSAIAAGLLRRAAGRVGLRLALPDGTVAGPVDNAEAPTRSTAGSVRAG